jgi:cysteine-rich repeat protein
MKKRKKARKKLRKKQPLNSVFLIIIAIALISLVFSFFGEFEGIYLQSVDISFGPSTPEDGRTLTDTEFTVEINTDSISTDQYTFLDFDDSLVLWLRMDNVDIYGNPSDVSGNEILTTLADDTSIVSGGRFGDGANFDGNGDYIGLGTNDNLKPEEFTISAWFNAEASYRSPIFTSGFSYSNKKGIRLSAFNSDSDLDARISVGDGTTVFGIQSDNDIPENTWTHIATTYDGSVLKLYINAVKQSDEDAFSSVVYSTGSSAIGTHPGTSGQDFDGIIDEVIFLSRALSAEEISTLYDSSANSYSNTFTGLTDLEDYTFRGFAVDSIRDYSTEVRNVIIDTNFVEICGDGIATFSEVCDGDIISCTQSGYTGNQYCNSICDGFDSCILTEYCGDGIINGNEGCEDGNSVNGDGCSSSCVIETDPAGVCGDGIIDLDEVCELGEAGDIIPCTESGYPGTQSCNSNCDGYDSCFLEAYCGDGSVNGNEACDDGNADNEDDCSNSCQTVIISSEDESGTEERQSNDDEEEEEAEEEPEDDLESESSSITDNTKTQVNEEDTEKESAVLVEKEPEAGDDESEETFLQRGGESGFALILFFALVAMILTIIIIVLIVLRVDSRKKIPTMMPTKSREAKRAEPKKIK